MSERRPAALVVIADPAGSSWSGTIADDDGVVHWGPHTDADAADHLRAVERDRRPRWVWWDRETPLALARLGVRPMHGWDLAAVDRVLHGGGRDDVGRLWARAHGLDVSGVPEVAPVDLFHAADDHDPERLVRPDGHLDPDWTAGGWATSPARRADWARAALAAFERQSEQLDELVDRPMTHTTVRVESAAALLAAELEVDGLPFDRAIGERLVADIIGPRPSDADDDEQRRAERDDHVLRHVPGGSAYDLRSPEQVRSMLRRCGVEVPDTRSWRLERIANEHPVVPALLEWRHAERVATTFGYRWMDDHVRLRPDGRARLHGSWSPSDGAAGRMTATAGLHNLPAELRPAVTADPGRRFVRADLGQIEPRILAAVSGDPALIRATADDDMYAPVAARLGVARDVAKVAVLGAMYGQTTGIGASALRGLRSAYPTAMALLDDADDRAQGGNDLRTIGGRRIALSPASDDRASAAARGRFGRNAIVQGAAAEFFKTWAVLVRLRGARHEARIVLCLHDELLVDAPAEAADEVAALVDDALAEAAHRWTPERARGTRFLADTAVIDRWSEAH